MTTPIHTQFPNTPDMELDMARKQVAEYAMALDLLSTMSHLDTERDAVESILGLFTILFSPRKIAYTALTSGKCWKALSSSHPSKSKKEIKNLIDGLSERYAWTASKKGFFLKITHKDTPLGIIEMDEIAFPEHKEHYLNLALAIVDVCGLAIENARKHEQLKKSENQIRRAKVKAERALAEVKKLSGLLPICSHCKKIRDDKGYWNQIETYIQNHSEAEFSHSICRECAENHYPGLNLYED